jgi:hypothetical protein
LGLDPEGETAEGEVNRNTAEYVRWIQQSLNRILGTQLVVDGLFGPLTRGAVIRFQQQRGLLVDGIVGPQTESALIAAGAGSPPGGVYGGVPPQDPASTAPSGVWVLPPNVRAAGEKQYVRYDAPPPWEGGKNCTGPFTAGAAELADYIRSGFPGVSSIGGYKCRQNTANAAETSVHGTGRALDITIPMVQGRANSAVGDPIANWLVQNAEAIGIQLVIWNRTQWKPYVTSGPKVSEYRGPNPHTDHIHAEITRDSAARATPWFTRRRQ